MTSARLFGPIAYRPLQHRPAHAVFTVGYRNRFGHPKEAVLARYRAAGASVWRTDRDGAVTVKLGESGTTVERYREENPRYWRWP